MAASQFNLPHGPRDQKQKDERTEKQEETVQIRCYRLVGYWCLTSLNIAQMISDKDATAWMDGI